MQYIQKLALAIAIILTSGNLQGQQTAKIDSEVTPKTYQQQIEDWHNKRVQQLRAPNGWLNLVGLYWLDEGRNSFGTSRENKIVFPEGSITAIAGYFERNGQVVRLVSDQHTNIKVDDLPVSEAVLYNGETAKNPVASYGSLRWTIIKREDRIGIRLRDLNSPTLAKFRDIDRFPVDTAWRLKATLKRSASSQGIAITNILGQTSQQRSPGQLEFLINGKTYTLDALEEGNELFIIFADETSGNSTYPSGRFLTVGKPAGPDGSTIIDFNKAYNPPCAFTSFATCPLPPKQNILPVAITAGEKNFGHH